MLKPRLKPDQLISPGDNSGVRRVKIIHVYNTVNNYAGNFCLVSIQKINPKKLRKIFVNELQRAVIIRLSGKKVRRSLIREYELTTTLLLLNKKDAPVGTRYVTRLAKFDLLKTRAFKMWTLVRNRK